MSMSSKAGCCGVTSAQCHLLLEVERRVRTSVTELAAALELDKSTLSRTVDAAVRAGLVDRVVDPRSRRRQVVRLTEAGQRTADQVSRLCDDSYTRLFDFVPTGKRALVMEAVELLAQAMRLNRTDPGAAWCGDPREQTP